MRSSAWSTSDATPGPRAGRHAGAPADRRAPPLRLALHAALAHRADRRRDAAPDPRAAGPAGDARADPRPQGLRPGHGLGRLPGRGLPPARRAAGRGLGRARDHARRSRRTRTSCSTPAAWSRSAASTASTRTRWRSTSPSSRSGSRRSPGPRVHLPRPLRSGTATRLVGLDSPADRGARTGTRARARPAPSPTDLVSERAREGRARARAHPRSSSTTRPRRTCARCSTRADALARRRPR